MKRLPWIILIVFFCFAQPASANWLTMQSGYGAGSCENYSNAVLLIHSNTTDGSVTFYDSANSPTSPKAITVGGNTHHETDQKYFGTTSIYFDGTNDNLSLAASSDWDFGAGDFTIAFWLRTATAGADVRLIQHFEAGVGGGWVLSLVSGTVKFAATGIVQTPITLTTVNDSTWRHIAVVRNGNLFVTYLSGVSSASMSSAAAITDKNYGLHIGTNSDLSADFAGYIDEIIIKKGEALWTADFTPPTAAYCD